MFEYPVWAANVFTSTDYELSKPPSQRDYKYLADEILWLAPRYSAWIDGHLVNDTNPDLQAANRNFIRRFYDLASVLAEWEHVVVSASDSAEFKLAVQTYSRIRKLLDLSVRRMM